MARLYPPVVVKGQSFVGVKRCTVPNQAMTLKEILARFVRREELPVAREGVYEDRFGDLEKISKSDITEQFEYAQELKGRIAGEKARRVKLKADRDAAKKAAEDAAALASATPVGESGVKPPPLQGS